MSKILLVDDETLILYSLKTSLGHNGSEVTAVTNGKDAIDAIRRMRYDICFLDVQLPDANGLDLVKTVREISPDTTIIIMTAQDLTERQKSSVSDNPRHFLPKPFDLDEVRSVVNDITNRMPDPPIQ